ncbi:D-aminoacyl-tRNA deacylase [Lentibacillus sp. CBA3610]|uniref:D-aminoacyl-tRNA deacylase n=1 Tax=Lentibacillus sp. CBA3610 TaxID=2518176 RepID=UPI00159602A3|nr:D-aminoacyl-tRNA deacylase [Lentibacillus sp. CBA3610]QKY69553.1 D-tyrosyl-tRNA(Tyr) deacylase [Lentibacillus sp. CBA3610]
MKAVIQRSGQASVTVNESTTGAIDHGLVVLLGVTHDDTEEDADYLVNKLVHLRIFDDENGKMNRSLKDISGKVLSISQFTLYADTRKGRRPSYLDAAKPEQANELYQYFNQQIEQQQIQVETGEFGEMMHVRLTNSGPVTIILDSHER